MGAAERASDPGTEALQQYAFDNIILYSSRREIKVVVRSHNKAQPKIGLCIHSILIIQSYKTHSLSLFLSPFERL